MNEHQKFLEDYEDILSRIWFRHPEFATPVEVGLAVLVAAMLLVSFATMLPGGNPQSKRTKKITQGVVFAIWVIIPAVWFWCEWYAIVRPALLNTDNEQARDAFFHFYELGHEISRNVWVAIGGFFGALFFRKEGAE